VPEARFPATDEYCLKGWRKNMAYLARIEPGFTDYAPLPPMADPIPVRTDFTPLEWSVIGHASSDGLWTIRPPRGRIGKFWNWLIGRGNPELANPQLEALRKMAVLSWHYGFSVAGIALADFFSAGFSPEQYELLVSSVTRAASARPSQSSPEVFA
jgi:hypothetical protein